MLFCLIFYMLHRSRNEADMTEDEAKSLTVSREDLYELVWSKPTRDLAKDFGISDVGLAKRCRRLGIPVPGRGYWARVDAGQRPYRPKLPQRDPQRFDDGALTDAPSKGQPDVAGSDSEGNQGSESEASIAQRDETWLQEKLDFEALVENAIAVPTVIRKWDRTIAQCRDKLEEAAEKLRVSNKAAEKAEKWPEWRKRTQFDEEGYAWRHVKDRGQRLWDTHKAVCFRVSLGTYKRAVAIVNALALVAPARGFTVREDEEDGRIVFAGHDAEVRLRVTEPLESKTRPTTRYDGKVEQEKYYVPTGRLRVTLQIDCREGPVFEDLVSRPLESQLNRVFGGIYRQVVREWREERKHQALHRKLDEEARQRAEAARIREERERAIAEARMRRRRLASEANRWTQANRIRNYIAHIRSSAGERADAAGELSAWMEWALSVATTLDPTERRLGQTRPESTETSQE
jgi:hypothetical protein